LVLDSQAASFNSAFDVISTKSSRREPRTAIGQINALHYIIIIADGRQEGYSKGMTLPELQQLFIDYGAQTAMNLDGGGSTELWFQGEIINRPSGGDERYVSDMIFF
jgi:exopolysaccharide biosynthesis protein